MLKMLLLWSLILLQTSDLFPTFESGWLYDLGQWSQSKEMKEVCDATFYSTCAAFCIDALVRGLDGASLGFASHLHGNTSPFNLVCL